MAADLVIVIWPLWGLMNAFASSSTMGPVFWFKGLFVQCSQYAHGQYQCDNYLDPVFNQSGNLILVRTLGVLSMITACVSCGLLLMGLDCIRLFEDNPGRKLYIMRSGIASLLTSGLLLFCISIFYATYIKREFDWFDQGYKSIRYILILIASSDFIQSIGFIQSIRSIHDWMDL